MKRMCETSLKRAACILLCALSISTLQCGGDSTSVRSAVTFLTTKGPAKQSALTSMQVMFDLEHRLREMQSFEEEIYVMLIPPIPSSLNFVNDPLNGCTANGEISTAQTSNPNVLNVDGEIMLTQCGASRDQGNYTLTWTITYNSGTGEYVYERTTLFEQQGSSLVIENAAVSGGYYASEQEITFNGVNESGIAYDDLGMTLTTHRLNIVGTATGAGGLSVAFQEGSYIALIVPDCIGCICEEYYFTTGNGLMGTAEVETGGKHSVLIEDPSMWMQVLYAVCDGNGGGTITYADRSTETFNLDL